MKKSILSASIAAMIGGLGLAGAANAASFPVDAVPTFGAPGAVIANNAAGALTLDNTGIGHILVVPYYTTQGTNATLLNIVNTDSANGKAVKVRFRGASNSDDVFDFTVLMSPGDVWAAKVSQAADGRSQLETSDKTCTLPAFVATQKNSFPTTRLNPAFTDAQKANETREGYIEILNMADIPQVGLAGQGVNGQAVATNPLFTAVKHVSGVAPCTTAVLDALKTDPTTSGVADAATATVPTSATGKGMAFPTGLLMANWTIIDTVKTATFSGEAVAVRATAGNNNGQGRLVFHPQSDDLVATASINALTADPLLRAGGDAGQVLRFNPTNATLETPSSGTPLILASMYDLPDLSTPYTTGAANPIAQAIALSTALAATSVTNEYLTTTSIAATTDWVFSMPTRRYNVAMNYAYTSPIGGNGRVFTNYTGAIAAGTAVTGTNFSTTENFFHTANTAVVNGQICVNADTGTGLTQWDREETTTSSQFVISPGTVTNVRFCGETSVLAFNNGTNTASGSLSASVALQNLNVNSNEGWVRLGTSGLTNKGLPVIGAAFTKSSSFGAVWTHRYTRANVF